MTQMLDCLVSYLGLDEYERPGFHRYFSYHVLSGPGPTADSGVAYISTLAVHDESQRCAYCTNVFQAEVGGPAAAIATALRYLDSYHEKDHLRRIQSNIRGLDDKVQTATLNRGTRSRTPQSQGVSTQKE